jgi:hypothetical protein
MISAVFTLAGVSAIVVAPIIVMVAAAAIAWTGIICPAIIWAIVIGTAIVYAIVYITIWTAIVWANVKRSGIV